MNERPRERLPAPLGSAPVATIDARALFLLGRADEARARGARFLQQYPTSARRRSVEAMLAAQIF
jgi:hypothetical protein